MIGGECSVDKDTAHLMSFMSTPLHLGPHDGKTMKSEYGRKNYSLLSFTTIINTLTDVEI